MDPICEAKINYLQKYVPFLANLIELLANDRENEGKLVQMQLLFDLLKKPDNSVNLNTLEKCEEVLSRVFGNADEKQNDDVEKNGGKEEISVGKLDEDEKNGMPTTEEDTKASPSNTNGYTQEKSENGDAPEDTQPAVDHVEVNNQLNEEKLEQSNADTASADSQPDDDKLNEDEVDAGPENTDEKPHLDHENEINKDDKSGILETPLKLNANEQCPDVTQPNTEIASPVETTGDTFILPDDPGIEETTQLDTNESKTELVESELATGTPEAMSGEAHDQQQDDNVIRQSSNDILPFKIISAESLAIQSVHSLAEDTFATEPASQPNDTAKDQTINESRGDIDPLATLDSSTENTLPVIPNSVPKESKTSHTQTSRADERVNEDDYDDVDDVLLIETRSSPICIDSDPEDSVEQHKLNISLPLLRPANASLLITSSQTPRASARKSTSAIMQRSFISAGRVSHQKFQKPIRDRGGYLYRKDPKALLETISLLDSDSDDDKPTQPPPRSTNKATIKDDDVIIVSSTQPARKSFASKKPTSVPLPKQLVRTPLKPTARPTSRPPTAQSNFLNAVNLQPAPKSSLTLKPSITPKSNIPQKPEVSPASFSAQLSNKKLIIPNAFYSNPPPNRKLPSSSAAVNQDESSSNDSIPRNSNSNPTSTVTQVQDRMLKEWLENFLANFASPQQLASHACFVLLQRVLKYRFFQRLKEIRLVLNSQAKKSSTEAVDIQLLLDLRNVFLKSGQLTESGRKFCRFATNDAFGKPVALTTDSRTGKVTCRTRIGYRSETQSEIGKPPKLNIQEKPSPSTQSQPAVPHVSPSNSTITSASPASTTPSTSSSSSSLNSMKRNRKARKQSDGTIAGDGDNNDNDYTPYMGELVLEDEIVSERKKSLRTNRTRRKEAGFTYSEDHDDEEFEALAKKIEDKKREELRLAEEREEREREKELEREKLAKKTVAKKTTSKRPVTNPLGPLTPTEQPREPTRKRLRLNQTEIIGNADDDLLTPTWVEADGDDCDDADDDSLQDFTEEPHSSENGHPPAEEENQSVPEPCDDSDDNDAHAEIFDIGTNKSLKNTDRRLHSRSLHYEFCVHCLRRVPRIVHHYVNEHRLSEVFTSRLRTKDIRRLLTTSNVGFVHLYKGNQQQYAAHCIFCDKGVKFLLPYWFEHFTMHTGEYGFKCSGCNIRKPTRSLLTNHLQSGNGCPKRGAAVRLYTFDTKSSQIEAHICTMCNFVQLHRKNIMRHLRTQHGVVDIKTSHIIRVVLLQISGPYPDEEAMAKEASQLSLLQPDNEDEQEVSSVVDNKKNANGKSSASPKGNSLMMQNDYSYNDDLSFTICGMLDVDTNLSTPGERSSKPDTSNHIDN